MSDKIDRKPATSTTTSAALKGVVAATGFGIMTPTRPFGEVLDHADREDHRSDNREHDERKTSREDRETSGSSESGDGDSKSVRAGSAQDEVGGVTRLKTKKQSPEQQFVEGKAVKPELMTLRDAGAHERVQTAIPVRLLSSRKTIRPILPPPWPMRSRR